MNTYFQHRKIYKYTWCRDSLGQRSLIAFLHCFSWFVPISAGLSCQKRCRTVDGSTPGALQLTSWKANRVCTNVLDCYNGRPWWTSQGCKKHLCRQWIDLVPTAPGMQSGRRSGVAAVASFAARVSGRKPWGHCDHVTALTLTRQQRYPQIQRRLRKDCALSSDQNPESKILEQPDPDPE